MRPAGFFKVFQDAALQLHHMLQASFTHKQGRFFAADAAGAKAHYGFVLQFGLVL